MGLIRCAGFGGHFFSAMQGGTTPDLGCIDIVGPQQGAPNDILVTSFAIDAQGQAPVGTLAPPGYFLRWALLMGQDIASTLFAGITAAGVAAPFAPIGTTGGEYGVGALVSAAPLLPSGVASTCLAQGAAQINVDSYQQTFPTDPDAPGALIIRAGRVGQFFFWGIGASGSIVSPTFWAVAMNVQGGPAKQVRRYDDGGLPVRPTTVRG
jgi:hypothetical protein